MAARVALLLVVTGLFTALWSGDHPDRMASVDRPSNVLIAKQNVVQAELFPQLYVSNGDGRSYDQVELFTLSDLPVNAPLPVGIAEGTYLVVDQWGHTEIRIVSRHQSRTNRKSAQTKTGDHYEVKIGNARWHYIRLEASRNERTATSTSSVSSVD